MRPLAVLKAAAVALLLSGGIAEARSRGISTIRDAEIEATLERMAAPIFRAAGLPDGSVEIFIVNDRTLNAFVVGRNMAFHTGLLIAMDDPNELLGVIAHETGHIAGGHGARIGDAASASQGAALLSTILGIAAMAAGAGQAGTAIVAGGQAIAQRGFLRYTRGQESAADQAALTYLERAGIDPTGMVETLRRLQAQELVSVSSRVDPYTLSHPLSAERIRDLTRRVQSSPALGRTIDAQTRYWYDRMRAKLRGFLVAPARTLREVPDDGSEAALLARAVAYHRTPDPQAALRTIDRLIAKRPNDAYYHELKGQILFEGGAARAAIPSYRQAAALDPGEPLILAPLGQALLALDDPGATAEAQRVLREAVRRDRHYANAWRWLAQAEKRAGNETDAALAAAEHRIMTGEEEVAARFAQQVQDAAPYGSPAWLRAGDILAEIDRRDARR